MNPNTNFKFATELPKDFSGTLHFTNFSDDEFKAKWNSVEYTFPPKSTVPLTIPTESPINTFNIRTIFAKQLADREFRRSKRGIELNKKNEGAQNPLGNVSYVEKDLEQLINKCLSPLPITFLKSEQMPQEGARRGRPRITTIVEQGQSLVTGQGESL